MEYSFQEGGYFVSISVKVASTCQSEISLENIIHDMITVSVGLLFFPKSTSWCHLFPKRATLLYRYSCDIKENLSHQTRPPYSSSDENIPIVGVFNYGQGYALAL